MSVARYLNKDADPLAYYSQADFERLVGTTLTLTAVGSTTALAELTLTTLPDLLPPDADRSSGREHFHLLFTPAPEADVLPSGTYRIEQREMGAFNLFLTAIASSLWTAGDADAETDAQMVPVETPLMYRAIVNRLSYSAMASEAGRLVTWPLHASRFNQEHQQTL
jgi:hypothetical protein